MVSKKIKGMKSTVATFPSAGVIDNLRLNICHVFPYYLRGIVTRNPCLDRILMFFCIHPYTVRFFNDLRKRHQSDYIYMNMLGKTTLFILHKDGAQHVLDNSPVTYAAPKSKHKCMSHFQPNAVTISHGDEWLDRRRFNEEVLDFGRPVHRFAASFLEKIQNQLKGKSLTSWNDFEVIFEAITLEIIFGNAEDTEITRTLNAMMKESNRAVLLGGSKHFEGFYEKIRSHLKNPRDDTLAALCSHATTTPLTKPENQIPHWVFATNATLASNTAKALALIAAHPAVQSRVREEILNNDICGPESIDQLHYLQGCMHEAMRLWPSVSLLMREAIKDDTLYGIHVTANTQVAIPNNFMHRDIENYPNADHFDPERWLNGEPHYAFNHLSNGPQVCAGRELALFIAKAVLATLLKSSRYELEYPTLVAGRPMPYVFNKYRLKLIRHTLN